MHLNEISLLLSKLALFCLNLRAVDDKQKLRNNVFHEDHHGEVHNVDSDLCPDCCHVFDRHHPIEGVIKVKLRHVLVHVAELVQVLIVEVAVPFTKVLIHLFCFALALRDGERYDTTFSEQEGRGCPALSSLLHTWFDSANCSSCL